MITFTLIKERVPLEIEFYVKWKLKVNSKIKQVKVVVIREISSWDTVLQGSGSLEEAFWGLNTEGMSVICEYVNGMVRPSREV